MLRCDPVSIVPHLGEPVRQHMLEIAPDKFEEFEFADAPFLLPAPAVFEAYMGVGDFKNTARRDGHAEDVLRQIFECSAAVADGGGVRVPGSVQVIF